MHIFIYIHIYIYIHINNIYKNTHIVFILWWTTQKNKIDFCPQFTIALVLEGKKKKKHESNGIFPVKLMGLRDCSFRPFNISALGVFFLSSAKWASHL